MKNIEELINKIKDKIDECKNEPLSFETEYNKLLLWYIPKSFELDEVESKMPSQGHDGGMEEKRQILRCEYRRQLSELKKKYGKDITAQDSNLPKKTERVHV
ncbi:MAG: hypothetical protein FWD71_07465 [Oscillospiraceae bacterium]|nr:hypothetical protein [Oscillospiraceae bacterium]